MWFSPKLFAIRPVVASNETFVEPLLKQVKYNGSEPVIWTDPSSQCRIAVEGVRRVIFDHLVLSNQRSQFKKFGCFSMYFFHTETLVSTVLNETYKLFFLTHI